MDGRELRETAVNMTFGYVIDALAELGVDGDALADRVAAALPAGEDPEPRVIGGAFVEVYNDAVPPFLATFAGQHVPFGSYEIIDYLASACETVGQGIECLGRYFGLINDQVVFDVSGTRVELRRSADDHDTFFDEYTSGIVLARFRARANRMIRMKEIAFLRAAPPAEMHARLTDYLGVAPTYGAKHTSFVLSDADWNTPLPKANKRLELRLIEVANEMLAEQQSGPFASTVRAAIVDGLREGDATIHAVARRLATTPRTLQRRLKDEGANFQDQLESLRRALAERYLKDRRLSIGEVAFLLGYSEASAFARAFRRWTGQSPQRYRSVGSS